MSAPHEITEKHLYSGSACRIDVTVTTWKSLLYLDLRHKVNNSIIERIKMTPDVLKDTGQLRRLGQVFIDIADRIDNREEK